MQRFGVECDLVGCRYRIILDDEVSSAMDDGAGLTGPPISKQHAVLEEIVSMRLPTGNQNRKSLTDEGRCNHVPGRFGGVRSLTDPLHIVSVRDASKL